MLISIPKAVAPRPKYVLMTMRGFLFYLISTSSLAILSASWLHARGNPDTTWLNLAETVWPDLEFGWTAVAVTVIGFIGSAFGTVGGVGGGGVFVPMLTIIVGFDTKSAVAISKCMVMAASISSVWYNLRVLHPTKEASIIDYDLALLFQPLLLLGITVGVALSVIFPYWLITVLIIILFIGTSSRSFYKGILMWKEETMVKKEMARQEESPVNSPDELLIDAPYEPLIPREEKSAKEILSLNLNCKMLSALILVWIAFLLLQVSEDYVTVCGVWYWVIFSAQLPIAVAVFGFEAVKLYVEDKRRMRTGNAEDRICEATIQWSTGYIAFCALLSLLGGCVGGLLGSGSGFVMGPVLLEIGVIPQVASATATLVMMFSSSLSVVEFYLLKRFPVPYALYLMSISLVAGFLGQYLVRKVVTILGRASIIVFTLSGVIFLSAITMGIIGVEDTIEMIRDHEFMGFLDFCSNK